MTSYGLLVFDDAEELDFVGPWEVFTASTMVIGADGDHHVSMVAERNEPVRCAKGMAVIPHHTLDDHPAYDVVLVPGGMGTRTEPVDLDDLVVASGSADLRAQLAQVYALLQALSPVDRVAWTLRHVEHCQLEEVASLCDCSLATAKRRILRAQRFLDERFVSLESAGADTSADDGSDATEAKTTDSGAPAARVRRRASASNRDRETS